MKREIEKRWAPLGAYAMPEGTNSFAFEVAQGDVREPVRHHFLDALGGIGFFRFGMDFDSDGDGLADAIETLWTMTDPQAVDSDFDGLTDGEEFEFGSNPLAFDTDADGLSDFDEINVHHTDPINADIDRDGLADGIEVAAGTDPFQPDSDGDGMDDGWEYTYRGAGFNPAVDNANNESVDGLSETPPVSAPSHSFFRSGGSEVISVSYGGKEGTKRQVMNQSDYLYYSGHGMHTSNSLEGDFVPEMAQGYWDRDLDCVILAGCSVLDINDYNGNYHGADHLSSPGRAWEQTGPAFLLGYCYSAPGDSGGAPSRIIQSWLANRQALGDVDAWMKANADNRAWNACAIVKGQKYVYYETRFRIFRRIKEVPKGEW